MRYQKVHMQRRKVTVHFGSVRLVVPCPNEEMTVAELAEAAVQRYKKATGKVEADVRIQRLECIRDGGILDPDDRVSDVFDESRDQILAIYDEQSPNGSGLPPYQLLSPIPASSSFGSSVSGGGPLTSSPLPRGASARQGGRPSSVYSSPLYPPSSSSSMDFPPPTTMAASSSQNNNGYAQPIPASYGRSPVIGRIGRESVVEVKNFDGLPQNGIRVTTPSDGGSSGSPPIRSSLRSETSTPSRSHRVTLSPEVEKRLTDAERQSSGRFARSSARKSRISETFYEAQERLEENNHVTASSSTSQQRVPPYFLNEAPDETILTFPDENRASMGVEITGVYNQPTDNKKTSVHLKCLEVTSIDADGRVGKDGRLRVGDRIVAIDGRPVYQMSILRARAYLADLQEKTAPTLTVDRNISTFSEPEGINERNANTTSSQRRPVQSALQQANTRAIGQTITVKLTKSSAGFGFTVTGRETAQGERLFYIGTVKPNGVALGQLRAGDRLLEVNGEKTSDMTQPEVVERLKRAVVGETVSFLVSRVSNDEDKENRDDAAPSAVITAPPQPVMKDEKPPEIPKDYPKQQSNGHSHSKAYELEEHEFVIPLNSTGSAGLGIRLKARATIRSDKSRQDCGIFIKALLHGGAADKDGRLRVDDRIIAIEGIRLDGFSNDIAGSKVSSCLKALGASSPSVKLVVQRKAGIFAETSLLLDHESIAVTATPSPISLRFSQSSDDKRSSITSDITRADELDAPSGDAFDREAPTRKSMSEKRGMGTSHDPNHIRLFQDIKHQRQTSAPPSASPMTSSFHGQSQTRSASQRAAARARSQSVHPRSPAGTTSQGAPQQHTAAVIQQHLSPNGNNELAKRRSLSMESLNTQKNASFVSREYEAHPFPPGTEIQVQRREPSTTNSRERQRRKSMGSAVKSFFGFGEQQQQQERSADRPRQSEAARMEEEDHRRAVEHYDRLRQKEASANRNLSTASSSMRSPYPPYAADYATPPQCASYYDYDLIDRYQAHRYPDEYHQQQHHQHQLQNHYNQQHRSSGRSEPPPYHYSVPSGKQQQPAVYAGEQQRSLPRRSGANTAPDYYHMFNSWFAYSGGGAMGAAPVIKAAYGSPNGRPKEQHRATAAWANGGRSPHFVPQTAEPSQLYANRFPHY